jgi:hypothetical protein
MRAVFRCTNQFLSTVERDLRRPHAHAAERVGFIAVRAAGLRDGLLLLAQDYYPVDDRDYVRDNSVGALIGAAGLRKALEIALLNPVGIFHVHAHEFAFGRRHWFSPTDLDEQDNFVPDFFKVNRKMPHGAIALGPHRTAVGRVWLAPTTTFPIAEFGYAGHHLMTRFTERDGTAQVADD